MENKKEENKNYKIVNMDELEGSTFKTKKKSFVSDVNPHLARRNFQKDEYIWLGTYDELMRNKNIINSLKKCSDTSFPLECAAIHLERHNISFCNAHGKVTPFLFPNEEGVVFLKLYLISKVQFLDLISTYYQLPLLPEVRESILSKLNGTNAKISLHETDSAYNQINNLGELDNILIYTLTTHREVCQLEIGIPSTEKLREIYKGLKKSFHPYSEYLIMYYVYRIDGVRNFYSISQMKECFFSNKLNKTEESSEYKISVHEHEKKLQALREEPGSPNIETVKCSTCNPSPNVNTPEKNHLNQFSYIFDLHHLPIFDENTGEFFWTDAENNNWKNAKLTLKSEEIQNAQSVSLKHGNLLSLTTSFLGDSAQKPTREDWEQYKVENSTGTFVEDLYNILKDFDKNN